MGSSARSTPLVLACLALACLALVSGFEYQILEVILCYGDETLETAWRPTRINYFDLTIKWCPPPASPYAEVLASRFNITALKRLLLYGIQAEAPLYRTHFTGLALSVLDIVYLKNDVCPDISFLESVTSEKVSLTNVQLQPLPQTVQMEELALSFGQSLGAWGGCSNLRRLRLHWWNVKRVPERWLAHCSKLTSLEIWAKPTSQALGRVLGGATSLRELKMPNCNLRKFDLDLSNLVNLQRLILSWNKLQNISASALPASLTSLSLMGNHLWSSAQVAEVLQQLPALQNLAVDKNEQLDLCEYEESSQLEAGAHRATLQQLVLPSVVRLSAARTATRRLCFGAMRTDSLTYLGLSRNNITVLKFRDLPVSKAPRLELDMEDNPVREVALEQADYEMLRDRVVVTGMKLSLACGCEHLWLARAVREGRVAIENARCSDGTPLASVTPERVQCDNFACADGACTCQRAWHDNATIARCNAGALRAVPRIPGLRALHAAGNRVRALSADDLPDSLLLLDLSGNNVSRADAAAAAALFARPGRRVRLARNPLRCACENRALLAALHEHRTQVEDYDDVTCINEGGLELALRDVAMAELCAGQDEGR